MPPTSSPVPSLSSVLSAVLTVHTIASGSPLRHHRTINQQTATTGKRLGLSVILPASSSSPSSSILQVVRYGKAKEQTEQEEREPGRRMPPTSSPVPSLSSVLSAVLTVHTIASGSPLRHHRTINQQTATTGKRLGLSVILPASSSSPSSSILQVVRYGKAKEQTEQEEREPGRRMPPPSSPVPRLSFCSV